MYDISSIKYQPSDTHLGYLMHHLIQQYSSHFKPINSLTVRVLLSVILLIIQITGLFGKCDVGISLGVFMMHP